MEWLTPQAQQQENSAVFPRFYMRQIEHKGKSLEAGRPIFVDVEYVEIIIAGDTKNIVNTKVTDVHRRRWPKYYEDFKNGVEGKAEGTPLKEWSTIPRTRALELNALNIYTVEQLAELPDGSIQTIGMDGRSLVTKAKAFLESSKQAGYAEKLALHNQSLKNDLDFLKGKIGPLLDKVDAMEKEINQLKGENSESATVEIIKQAQ